MRDGVGMGISNIEQGMMNDEFDVGGCDLFHSCIFSGCADAIDKYGDHFIGFL